MKLSMIIRKTIHLFLLVLLFVPVYGQKVNSEISKEEIINKAWAAMFGELKPENLESIYVEGFFHGRDVSSKMTVKRPNLFRNEVASGILVFDSKRAAWVMRTPDAQGNPRNPEIIDTASWRHFQVDIALIFPAFFEYPSKYKGIKEYEGTDVYELYVELPLGSNLTYFIDTKSFLVTRRLVCWSGDPTEELWENIITGYTNYDGILFPEGYTYQGRNGTEKGIYKNVKINIKPADELFKIPDELN